MSFFNYSVLAVIIQAKNTARHQHPSFVLQHMNAYAIILIKQIRGHFSKSTGGNTMNVLQNLVELYDQLPPGSTYKEVARGILGHLEEVADSTIYEVAELTNSSRTTVWRMVQKMGYENFSDFHHALKQAMGHYSYYNRIQKPELCTDENRIVSAFLHQTKNARSLMEKHFTAESLLVMADKIHEADKVAFYFPYHTFSIASFQQNLSVTGKETDYVCLIPDMKESSSHLTRQSIVFIETIDHAESMDAMDVFITAKAAGAHIIKVSQTRTSYDPYTDEYLLSFDTNDVTTNLILITTYFLMLSEIYRAKYIDHTI